MGKTKYNNRILWILLVMIVWYVLLIAPILHLPYEILMQSLDLSPSMYFILGMYGAVIVDIITLIILCCCFKKKNLPILKSFRLGHNPDFCELARSQGRASLEPDELVTYNNTWKFLLTGLVLGFLTNFIGVAAALIHGDIKLVLDFSASGIPVMLLALFCVLIQSSSEEFWCRGLMYERINVHYPLWVSILVNGVFFGLLHVFNPGVSVMAIFNIVICGISYSMLRWYSGSMWICMGIHAGWNFTQNFIFGLPNSGIVSETSIFRLDAANGMSNLVYDFDFGVEGGIFAFLADFLIIVVILYMAKRTGRLGELKMTKEQRARQLFPEAYAAEAAPETTPAEAEKAAEQEIEAEQFAAEQITENFGQDLESTSEF